VVDIARAEVRAAHGPRNGIPRSRPLVRLRNHMVWYSQGWSLACTRNEGHGQSCKEEDKAYVRA
jgi:hypothetical protein